MAAAEIPSRRERLRAQTFAEIKQHALEQIAADGPESLALTRIAKTMGMSGPGIYRYFASRDDLLAALVAEAWGSLADALEEATRTARGRSPEARLRAIAAAYRDWALAQPHRYRLALETSYGSGRFHPELTLPETGRAMMVLLDAIAAFGPLPTARPGASKVLDAQLRAWIRDRALRDDLPPAALQLAVLTWTRLHGTVALELVGVFESMALDPALLHRAEVDQLIAQIVAVTVVEH